MKNYAGQKVAVFDAEIKKRIEDCTNGWKSHDEMGISVLVIFDYLTMRYRIFDDHNKDEALDILNNYDLVVGFNTVGFDWKLLRATWPYEKSRTSKDYDILRQIWIAQGLDPDHFDMRTHGGFKLDDVAADTIGMRKTANGALAPVMFQQGKIAELTDYCVEDVRIEKTLFEFAATYGYVVRNGHIIHLDFPPL